MLRYKLHDILKNQEALIHIGGEDLLIETITLTVVEEANRKIQQALEMFNFEVYDQPYFEDVSSTVVGEDLAELITTMLESM